MCTVIVAHQCIPGVPLLVASNRDEFKSRPFAPPGVLDSTLELYGGRDEVAGGSWAVFTGSGAFVAVTNQRSPHPPDPHRLSRGQLVLDVARSLAIHGVSQTVDWVRTLDPHQYNPFHLVVGDASQVWWMGGVAGWEVKALPAGISVVTNDGLNPGSFPKVEQIQKALHPPPATWNEWTHRMESILLDRTPPQSVPEDAAFQLPVEVRSALHSVFVDLPQYGTVSSAIAWMGDDGLLGYRVWGEESSGFEAVMLSESRPNW